MDEDGDDEEKEEEEEEEEEAATFVTAAFVAAAAGVVAMPATCRRALMVSIGCTKTRATTPATLLAKHTDGSAAQKSLGADDDGAMEDGSTAESLTVVLWERLSTREAATYCFCFTI